MILPHCPDIVTFRGSKQPFGWLSNMAARYPIYYQGQEWPTAEALFQALRFTDPAARDRVRAAGNGFAAKMAAKSVLAEGIPHAIVPRTPADLDNMRVCVRLKADQHPDLARLLADTGDKVLVEDVSRRPVSDSNEFWGMRLAGGCWIGENHLGRTWMQVRAELGAGPPAAP